MNEILLGLITIILFVLFGVISIMLIDTHKKEKIKSGNILDRFENYLKKNYIRGQRLREKSKKIHIWLLIVTLFRVPVKLVFYFLLIGAGYVIPELGNSGLKREIYVIITITMLTVILMYEGFDNFLKKKSEQYEKIVNKRYSEKK